MPYLSAAPYGGNGFNFSNIFNFPNFFNILQSFLYPLQKYNFSATSCRSLRLNCLLLHENKVMEDKMDDSPARQDEQFMRKALAEAEAAREAGEIPVGAVITCRDRVIARAHNLTETLRDVTAHAEMQAITAAADAIGGKYLAECTLYVTVEPCVMCAGAIGWAQVRRVVYGASDEKRGFTRYAPGALHPKATVTAGVLEADCRRLMQDFFKAKR